MDSLVQHATPLSTHEVYTQNTLSLQDQLPTGPTSFHTQLIVAIQSTQTSTTLDKWLCVLLNRYALEEQSLYHNPALDGILILLVRLLLRRRRSREDAEEQDWDESESDHPLDGEEDEEDEEEEQELEGDARPAPPAKRAHPDHEQSAAEAAAQRPSKRLRYSE